MSEKAPCYGCIKEIKCPWCHTFCPEFIAWETAHNKARDERNAEKMAGVRLWEQQCDGYDRTQRRIHNRRKV